jgi:hypothetical protein
LGEVLGRVNEEKGSAGDLVSWDYERRPVVTEADGPKSLPVPSCPIRNQNNFLSRLWRHTSNILYGNGTVPILEISPREAEACGEIGRWRAEGFYRQFNKVPIMSTCSLRIYR